MVDRPIRRSRKPPHLRSASGVPSGLKPWGRSRVILYLYLPALRKKGQTLLIGSLSDVHSDFLVNRDTKIEHTSGVLPIQMAPVVPGGEGLPFIRRRQASASDSEVRVGGLPVYPPEARDISGIVLQSLHKGSKQRKFQLTCSLVADDGELDSQRARSTGILDSSNLHQDCTKTSQSLHQKYVLFDWAGKGRAPTVSYTHTPVYSTPYTGTAV